MIRALVFDFDGLILETEQPIYQSWQEVFEEFGLVFPFELWAQNIGTAVMHFDPESALSGHVKADVDLRDVLERRARREMRLIGDQPLMPGVLDYLKQAKILGLKIGLASSSTYFWVEGHLQRLGIRHYFDIIQTKENVKHTKPDPALFTSAVEILGVSAGQTIAFEDSQNGILAAKRAGLYCVAVPNKLTRRTDTSLADLTLDSLADLPLDELIHRFNGKLPD